MPGALPARATASTSRIPDGLHVELDDPYSFLPTLGELDVHLASEGSHEQLYEKLGAHVREVDGVRGTAFAVWAPNARSVSVVGDFNSWDGRLHQMRTLGASGIWELFLPGVEDGARYKFELRYKDGSVHLRADPYALATEHAAADRVGRATRCAHRVGGRASGSSGARRPIRGTGRSRSTRCTSARGGRA